RLELVDLPLDLLQLFLRVLRAAVAVLRNHRRPNCLRLARDSVCYKTQTGDDGPVRTDFPATHALCHGSHSVYWRWAKRLLVGLRGLDAIRVIRMSGRRANQLPARCRARTTLQPAR